MSAYFQLFRLPESFSLDNNALEQTYRTLVAQFHPDKFAAASAFEQKQAMMMSAKINEAHAVLSDPINRAAYLLQQQNINPDDPHNTQVAPDFLMQQIEWREALMDAKMDNNAAKITALRDEILKNKDELLQQLIVQFDNQQFNEAADSVRKGRFLDKMLREIAATA